MQISGLDLRYALTTLVLRAGVPQTVAELDRALEQTRSRITRRVADLRLAACGDS